MFVEALEKTAVVGAKKYLRAIQASRIPLEKAETSIDLAKDRVTASKRLQDYISNRKASRAAESAELFGQLRPSGIKAPYSESQLARAQRNIKTREGALKFFKSRIRVVK